MSQSLTCFHCGLPVPEGTLLALEYEQVTQHFCCEGCRAVSAAIIHQGLDNYYRQRDARSEKAREIDTELEQQLAIFDREDVMGDLTEIDPDHPSRHYARLYLDGITCAACIWLIENYIGKITGVEQITVNHTNHIATVTWDNDKIPISDILKAVYTIGYEAKPFKTDEVALLQGKEQKRAVLRLGLAGVGMMQNMMLAVPLYLGSTQITDEFLQFFRWISMVVATPVVLYSAQPFFLAAMRDIKTRHLTMDVPVSLAIFGAYIASCWITVEGGDHVYFDSVCMFTFFLTLGRFLEMRSRFKASASINKLATLLPQTANRISPVGTLEIIPARELAPGDQVLVKPGQTIPCDGEVIQGVSTVNESALTGEHLPTQKQVGSSVVAGTTNEESPLTLKVTHAGSNTRISSIVRLFDSAISEKPGAAQIADRVASYFVAVLLMSSALVYLFWNATTPEKAFEITLAVLVVTCPCALSLATPTTFTAAMDGLRQIGLLSLKGHVLESLAHVQRFIFDKTGTLTLGEHKIIATAYTDYGKKDELDEVSRSLECHSSHPLAQAFLNYSANSPKARFSSVKQITGLGMEGIYKGQAYRLGSLQFVSEITRKNENIRLPSTPDQLTQSVLSLCTPVYLGNSEEILATYYLQDEIRPSSRNTVSKLHHRGITTEILSGDTELSAQTVGNLVGIGKSTGEVSPEGKLAYLNQMRSKGEVIAMVGDGINDIPVMAAAHVSIAMGKSSDITKIHADAILLKDDLNVLPEAIKLARKSSRILKQNLVWAAGYNLTALPLAIAGLVPPYLAAIGMSLSSLLVVLNALRARNPTAN